MIEIEEPPDDQQACSTCMSPLTWIYVHHLRRNVAVVPVQNGIDRYTFRLHTCPLTVERTWRHVQLVDPKITKRGARRARAVLDAKTKSRKAPQPIDDKETTRP